MWHPKAVSELISRLGALREFTRRAQAVPTCARGSALIVSCWQCRAGGCRHITMRVLHAIRTALVQKGDGCWSGHPALTVPRSPCRIPGDTWRQFLRHSAPYLGSQSPRGLSLIKAMSATVASARYALPSPFSQALALLDRARRLPRPPRQSMYPWQSGSMGAPFGCGTNCGTQFWAIAWASIDKPA